MQKHLDFHNLLMKTQKTFSLGITFDYLKNTSGGLLREKREDVGPWN